MNFSASPKLAEFTTSAAMPLENGSKDSACEMKMVGPAPKPLLKDTSPNDQADTQEHSFGFGTPQRRPQSSMECDTNELLGPYSVRQSGNVGQEILDVDGKIIAWTTEFWVALVVVKLLNENEGLLR